MKTIEKYFWSQKWLPKFFTYFTKFFTSEEDTPCLRKCRETHFFSFFLNSTLYLNHFPLIYTFISYLYDLHVIKFTNSFQNFSSKIFKSINKRILLLLTMILSNLITSKGGKGLQSSKLIWLKDTCLSQFYLSHAQSVTR